MNRDNLLEAATTVEERIIKSNGEVIVRRYTKGRFLGKGGFAKCYEMTSNDSQKVYAAKVVSKSSLAKSRARQKLMSEVKIHSSLHHSGVVRFEQFFEDAENIYMLLELCANQTLSELIKRRRRLTELETKCYAVQLIEGLKYLHAHRVIHRDLKLGNLFLTDRMVLKIGDFGLATKLEFEGERKRTICGTPNYIAPEILEGRVGHSYEVDIWSLGVIIFTLLVGKPPFETQDVKTTYKRIRMNIYAFPENVEISDLAKNLVHRVLSSDPLKRPKLEEILSHPFFTDTKIPSVLPSSTLVCQPSSSFVKQYTGREEHTLAARLESTGPYKENLGKGRECGGVSTERGVAGRQKTGTVRPMTGRGQGEGVALKETEFSELAKENVKEPEVWIKKWVDYSSKYGLGYLLSNGSNGVFFNDSTKILLEPDGHFLHYVERKGYDKADVMASYTLEDYPKTLQKKVTLLQHFRNYLEQDLKQKSTAKPQAVVYIKKWLKTKHAVMFRLNNKTVQMIFQDETEVVLRSEAKVVTYVNKQGERTSYQLSSALESDNGEMKKRLKYTKEVLTRMLKENQHHVATRPFTQHNIANQI